MSDTIQAALIGGLIATVPGLFSMVVDLVKHWRQQKHDLELRHFNMYSSSRFEAIEAYAQALTRFIIYDHEDRDESWNQYIRAYERASLLVSDDTRSLMRAAYGKLIPETTGHIAEYRETNKALRSPEYDALLSALHREMFSPLPAKQHEAHCRQCAANHPLNAESDERPVKALIKRLHRAANPFRKSKGKRESDASDD